jgi:hypothetical protein
MTADNPTTGNQANGQAVNPSTCKLSTVNSQLSTLQEAFFALKAKELTGNSPNKCSKFGETKLQA